MCESQQRESNKRGVNKVYSDSTSSVCLVFGSVSLAAMNAFSQATIQLTGVNCLETNVKFFSYVVHM